MPTIAEIRQQYPQYKDMSDEQLGSALHRKFYSDMPAADFAKKIGLPEPKMGWGDVAAQAVTNIPSSAVQFGKDIAQPVLHPIETAQNLAALGKGGLSYARDIPGLPEKVKSVLPAGDEATRAPVQAMGQYFADRYGGMENFKKTLASDPVGVAGDLATVFGGGEAALARAPGIVGKVGKVSGALERATNPLMAPLAAAKGVGSMLAPAAARAGEAGGATAEAFRTQMRGQAPQTDVVTDARRAVQNIRRQRTSAYLSDIGPILRDPTPLNYTGVDRALNLAKQVKTYKGISLDPAVEKAVAITQGVVDTFKHQIPRPTIADLDALKKAIYSTVSANLVKGTAEYTAAMKVYNGVRQSIVRQNPRYSKVMVGYEDAEKQLSRLEKELTGKPGANVETALRKLQSTLKDKVSPIYANRKVLAEYLAASGAPNLMEKLAAQRHRSWMPSAFGKQLASFDLALSLGAILFGHPSGFAAAAIAPLASPRLRGEIGYLGGTAARPLKSEMVKAGARTGLGSAQMYRAEDRGKKKPYITITPAPEYGGPQE